MIENHRMTIFESYFHIKLRKNLKNHSGADFNLMKNQFFSNSYFKDFIRIFYDLVRYHPKSILLRHICIYLSPYTTTHEKIFRVFVRRVTFSMPWSEKYISLYGITMQLLK